MTGHVPTPESELEQHAYDVCQDCGKPIDNPVTGQVKVTPALTWDEPAGAASPRGWAMARAGHCVGFYLDYGPDHYRLPHETEIRTVNGPMMRVWCQPGAECKECQPGNVLAVRYPNGPGTEPHRSRYVETIAEAREYIEVGAGL